MVVPEQLMVQGFDETSEGDVDLDRWCEVAGTTLEGEGVLVGHLDLIFVDPDEMAELNLEHMGQDRPTDVLAFPLDGPDLDGPDRRGLALDGLELGPADDGPPRHLGDVVVCPIVARDQAPGHCGPEQAELTLLVVHGVLHVLGHDHADTDERLVMQARERHHLNRYGFTHPEPK